jgi:hypothetical protein
MNFHYRLDGVDLGLTPQYLTFSSTGFSFLFGNQMVLQFTGPDLASDGTIDAPTSGLYSVYIPAAAHPVPSLTGRGGFSALAAPGPQLVGMATVVTTAQVAGVPEPSAWALTIVGFGAAGSVLRRRRRRAVLA